MWKNVIVFFTNLWYDLIKLEKRTNNKEDSDIMLKRYSAQDIAKWFINEIHPEPLKLQKLLYLSQGFSFAFNDKELFYEEMEAWVHGPVVPSVYHTFRSFSFNPIDVNFQLIDFDPQTLDILNYVKNNFSKYDSKFLEEMTHNQEPWILARVGLDPDERSDKTISKSSIANYFINSVFQPEEEEWD